MLRTNKQQTITEFSGLYERVVPKEHLLRRIKEEISFSFVNPMLSKSYCVSFGRPAKEPEMMFKLLLLKKLYDISDEMLIGEANVNMAFKYFLDINPEDTIADASLLTKFRKLRVTEDILSDMLKEIVRQAIAKGIIKSNAIIVDSMHVLSKAGKETPAATLRRLTKELRKEIYQTLYDLSDRFPEKPAETAELSEEIAYSGALLEAVRQEIERNGSEKAKQLLQNVSDAYATTTQSETIQSLTDPEAKIGFKSENHSFFGYKVHLAMTAERMISGVNVTSGEANDGANLQILSEQSMKNGVTVKEIIGDKAYSSKSNLDYTNERGIKLISALHPVVSNGTRKSEGGFLFNKDADRMQCPAGHLASKKKVEHRGEGHNDRIKYWWNASLCCECPLSKDCLQAGAKGRTYSVTILSDAHAAQKVFQETDYFKLRMKERYKIEAKNAELKNAHGLRRADSTGLTAMRLQAYLTAFTTNVKRIVHLLECNKYGNTSRTTSFQDTTGQIAANFCSYCFHYIRPWTKRRLLHCLV